MLGGLDPIIIFQFSKSIPAVSEVLAKIPLVSQVPTLVDAPPIPIYLSENITGIFIDSESKNIDIETTVETKSDGSAADVTQKGLNSIVKVTMKGNKDSLGLTLLSAMSELILDRVTAKEYSITYLHGAITVFRGLLHSLSIEQVANSTQIFITIELSKGQKQPQKSPDVPVVQKTTGVIPL